ncbi:hypothetical protein BHE74_00039863 [Ensete ventricosum]|nr:hypothetical protein BHE74_00039863 [Ensete ventricosum]
MSPVSKQPFLGPVTETPTASPLPLPASASPSSTTQPFISDDRLLFPFILATAPFPGSLLRCVAMLVLAQVTASQIKPPSVGDDATSLSSQQHPKHSTHNDDKLFPLIRFIYMIKSLTIEDDPLLTPHPPIAIAHSP